MNPQESTSKYLETINLEMAKFIYSTSVNDIDTFKTLLYDNEEVDENGGKYPFKTYYKNVMGYLEKVIDEKGNTLVSYKKSVESPQGRDFVKGFGIQSLQFKVRGALCRDIYTDYDMCNCHPVILLYCVKKNPILKSHQYSHLEEYVNNRATILKTENLTKKQILININTDKPRHTKNDWLKTFNKQLIAIKSALIEEKDEDELTTTNTDNPISSRINKLLCSYENHIIHDVIDGENITDCVKMFDGFMTNQKLDIDTLNNYTTEYNIKWSIKKHDESINIEEYENITTPFSLKTAYKLGYIEMKKKFEQDNRIIHFLIPIYR
jgi:hypothetical protein